MAKRHVDDETLSRELRAFAKQAKIPVNLPEPKPKPAPDPRDDLYPGGVVPENILAARDAAEIEPRKPGRPRRGHGVPWEEIEQIFIFGEPYTGQDGVPYVRYPTMKELGDRFNVNPRTISRRVHDGGWLERRQHVKGRQDELIGEALLRERVERQVDARADATEVCELLIAQVKGAVQEGRFTVNSPRELDTIVRLFLKLSGEADKVHQHQHDHVHDLSTLQSRFADARRRHNRLPSEFGTAGRRGEMPPLPIDVDISEFDNGD